MIGKKRTWCGEPDFDTVNPPDYECTSFEEFQRIKKANENNEEAQRHVDMLLEDCRRISEIIASL